MHKIRSLYSYRLAKAPKRRKRGKQRNARPGIALALVTVAMAGFIVWLYAEARNPVPKPATATQANAVQRPQGDLKDVRYNDTRKLDLYFPRKPAADKSPLIIYIHGGGWEMNTKSSEPQQLALLDPMRDKGYAVASIDYARIPDRPFPAPLSDTLAAIRFLRANAGRYGLDADKFGLYGFSAGGHLASLAATIDTQNPFNNGPYKDTSSRVQAVVTLAGIFDLYNNVTPATAGRISTLMNGQDISIAEPATYLTPDDPPFMLIHGLKDQYVSVEQDIYMAGLLTRTSVNSTQLLVKNADHGLGPVDAAISPDKMTISRRMYEFYQQAFEAR